MKQIRKWAIRIGVVILVVLLIGSGIGIWLVRRPWPQVNGTITVPGLLAPVEIVRDRTGVPHVFSQNEHDLFFTQGYVHAQDRLWQMEINRRIGCGTLSEILGEAMVDTDRLVRTLGLRRAAEQAWTQLDQDARIILEAYAEGVNAYIQSHRDRLPLEFTLLGDDPEPWTPVDSLTFGSVLALNMGLNSQMEILQARTIAKLGANAAQSLFLSDAPELFFSVPDEVAHYSWLQSLLPQSIATGDQWLSLPYSGWGSNNWVVHGSRTATGQPILANDTHLDLAMPSVWYENGLHGGRFDSVGFTFPGVPLVVVGRNTHIAWGITNLDADVQDLYVEKLDSLETPKKYQFEGEWHDLEVIQETIKVRASSPISLNVFLTQHGPIVNDIFGIPVEKPLSLRWTLYEGNDIFAAIAKLNWAANWDEFRASLQQWDVLGQNFVYADDRGNIGYQAAGRVPIRSARHQGLLPVPGWTGEYEWQGFIPFSELPNTFNPPEGFIATANNKVISDTYPYKLTYDWSDPGYRAKRITSLLAANDRLSIQDIQNIQADTYLLPVETLRSYLLAINPENAIQADALARVKTWNLCFDRDSVGASIYEVWYLYLLDNTIRDDLGQDLWDGYHLNPTKHVPMMVHLMSDAGNTWFDDINTPQVETRDDIVRRSLTDAVKWLTEHYGQDPAGWQWGKLHTVTFRHLPLGRTGIAPLMYLFNSQPIASSGGPLSVNVALYNDPFDAVFGTSQRMIIDLADPDTWWGVNSTGQSGHLFHPHRQDMISKWQNVESYSVPFTRKAVEAEAEARLLLKP